MKTRAFVVLLAAGASCLLAYAQDDEVLPYRPSVSTPAQLPTPGQLEFELGGLQAHAGGDSRASLPYQLKLAFDPEWGVLLGGDAWVSQRLDGGPRTHGTGKTGIVLKRALTVSADTAFGLELGAALPTGSRAVADSATDWNINTIWSQDFGALHMDANLNRTRFGHADEGAGRMQDGAAVSFSLPLDERWSATWEVSGTRQHGADSTAQVLAALSYAPRKSLTIDAGLARNVGPTHGWSVFAGYVVPLAHLW